MCFVSIHCQFLTTEIPLDLHSAKDSHGGLRLLQDKTDAFTCAQQDKCIKLTFEEVENGFASLPAFCFPGGPPTCAYRVCIEYNKQAADCPDFFRSIGRSDLDAIPPVDSVDECASTSPIDCELSSINVFGTGQKRCVVGYPEDVVRFSLREGLEKVCDPLGRQTFNKTYGELTLSWTCGRNPPDGTPELVSFNS
jgi:hypothetical protein